jgi:biopolymer transport protein ExbD
MAAIQKSQVKKARIEIIPLIDVIFFLLATFVLFTLSLNKLSAIPLDLPKATPTPPERMPDIVRIQVSESGTLYWNRELIQMSDVAPRLANYKNNETDPRVLVAGDIHATVGPVVEVLDQVRDAGIEKVSIETRVSDTGR